MNYNKNVVEEALFQIRNLEETLQENAKGILQSTMSEEIKQLVKESLREQDEIEEPVDDEEMDPEMEMDDEDMEMDDEDMEMDDEDMEMDDEDMEMDDDEMAMDDDEMEMDPEMDDETIDMTDASDAEVLRVFKAMGDDDGIVIKKEGSNINLKDGDNEYMIQLGESYGNNRDQLIYEIEMGGMDDMDDETGFEPIGRNRFSDMDGMDNMGFDTRGRNRFSDMDDMDPEETSYEIEMDPELEEDYTEGMGRDEINEYDREFVAFCRENPDDPTCPGSYMNEMIDYEGMGTDEYTEGMGRDEINEYDREFVEYCRKNPYDMTCPGMQRTNDDDYEGMVGMENMEGMGYTDTTVDGVMEAVKKSLKSLKSKGTENRRGPKFSYDKKPNMGGGFNEKRKEAFGKGIKAIGTGKPKFEYKKGENMEKGSMKRVETKEAARTYGNGSKDGSRGLRKARTNNRNYEYSPFKISENYSNNEVYLLKEKNEEYKAALDVFRTKLNEVAVFNSNLAYATRLFTEHSTTKQEKINILRRFDNLESLKESKNLYRTIKGELSSNGSTGEQKINESIQRTVNKTADTGSSVNLIESKTYENPQFLRMKDLMTKIK